MLDQRLDAPQIDDQQNDRRNASHRRNERPAVSVRWEATPDGRIRVHARRPRKFDAGCPQRPPDAISLRVMILCATGACAPHLIADEMKP
jgi:hypothetical protein